MSLLLTASVCYYYYNLVLQVTLISVAFGAIAFDRFIGPSIGSLCLTM